MSSVTLPFCLPLSPATEEFLGSLPPKPRVRLQSPQEVQPTPPIPAGVASLPLEALAESWAVLSPTLAEAPLSESSESISLVTQVAKPVAGSSQTAAPLSPVAQDLAQRLQEATLEEQAAVPKPAKPTWHFPAPPQASSPPKQPQEPAESKPASRTEALREDGPMDLRVFELNSDSGKSTPSNHGKKGGLSGRGRVD